jgi:hypothetical protein
MFNNYMDETTFEILYQNLCMGVSQEELARKYSYDSRFDTQSKISKCVIEHGFHTGIAGFQARLARKHLLGLSREEFRRYVAGYKGSRDTNLEDFFTHINEVNNRAALQQSKQQQYRPASGQRYEQPQNFAPAAPTPAPVPEPAPLTIGELRRLRPDAMTPQQLATLKNAGYVYDPVMGWKSPEMIAQEKAQEDHEARMRAAGYVEVGDMFTGTKWMKPEEIAEHAARTLAEEKFRLAEFVIENIKNGEFEFDVAFLGHIAPGAKPERTFNMFKLEYKKRKLPFLPEKMDTVMLTYPAFHLLRTYTYGEDIEDVNKNLLMPLGYRISEITIIDEKSRQGSGLPDVQIVTLTCQVLNQGNAAYQSAAGRCPQCGAATTPDSVFCSRCGMKLQ